MYKVTCLICNGTGESVLGEVGFTGIKPCSCCKGKKEIGVLEDKDIKRRIIEPLNHDNDSLARRIFNELADNERADFNRLYNDELQQDRVTIQEIFSNRYDGLSY